MVETKHDNPTLEARVWVSEGNQYLFAEMASGVLPKTPNTGVCFSGGGTRSLSATMGQLRGLTELNLIENIRYISCVSGGSWASTLYTYYKTGDRGPVNDAEFLGKITPPQEITMKGLANNDPKRLGSVATRSLEDAIIGLIGQGTTPVDRLWIEAVGQTYFQPFGLHDPKQPAYFSLDCATVEDIKRRNPSLAQARFHTVRTEAPRPYLIVNSTLVGPAALAPFKVESLVGFEYTPLYIGSPFGLEVTFKPKSGEDTTLSIGGGSIEPFAFGGSAPTDAPFNCQPASPASS